LAFSRNTTSKPIILPKFFSKKNQLVKSITVNGLILAGAATPRDFSSILTYCNSLKEVTGAVCSGGAAAALLPRNLQGEEVVCVTRNAR
jgi:hypothetical protein